MRACFLCYNSKPGATSTNTQAPGVHFSWEYEEMASFYFIYLFSLASASLIFSAKFAIDLIH